MNRPGDPVAIVATACRYPGANNPDELWDLVLHRGRAFRDIPRSRLGVGYRSHGPAQSGPGGQDLDTTYVTRAGLLADWDFDRERFSIPRRLHEAADTSHWLALETADSLLDQLGGRPGIEDIADTTGVVLGNSLTGEYTRAISLRLRWPYVQGAIREALTASWTELNEEAWQAIGAAYNRPFPEPGDESLAGALSNTIAGRICNQFDLHGTGYTVDGACSSSLLAVAQARTALLAGDLDLVLAGGVDVSLDPFELVGFARLGALATDTMRVYDAHPTGFLPGEGCGMVALARASDATARGWPILGLLLGCGTSSDGSGGLTRPARSGHLSAARRAYRNAGVDPTCLGYLEGHGTGTAVGDATEISALTDLRGHATRPAALGSVKANIGHTKAAAGVAGLIKVVQSFGHGVIPPTTGCDTPHRLLAGNEALHTLTEPEAWPGRRWTAGISSMGFGGINCHVVVRAATSGAQRARPAPIPRQDGVAQPTPQPAQSRIEVTQRTGDREIWALAAPSPQAMLADVRHWGDLLTRLSDVAARDLAWQRLNQLALEQPVRAAFTAATIPEARTHLMALASELESLADVTGGAGAGGTPALPAQRRFRGTDGVFLDAGPAARVGLLFPGQASPVVDPDIPLVHMVNHSLTAEAARRGLRRQRTGPSPTSTQDAQPGIVAASLLGLAWLETLGVRARTVLGHSLGEITALAWCGALTPDAAVDLAAMRGQLMAELGIAETGMVSVAADVEATRALLKTLDSSGHPCPLHLAGVNSPTQTTVSGSVAALLQLIELARRRGLTTRLLDVSHGFHSEAMRPIVCVFTENLARYPIADGQRGYYSSVTGARHDPGECTALMLRQRLTAQLCQPVLFAPALQTMCHDLDLLLEVGPGDVLATLAHQNTGLPAISLNVGRSTASLASATAALVAAGLANPAAWLACRPHHPVNVEHIPKLLANPCDRNADATAPSGRSPATPLRPDHDRDLDIPAPSQSGEPASTHPIRAADDADSVEVLIGLLAEAADLDGQRITVEQSLSRDLHLNSLQVVQIVARAADALGRSQPAEPLSMADATVGACAQALAALPEVTSAAGDLAGAPSWVRIFRDDWEPLRPRRAAPADQPQIQQIWTCGTDDPHQEMPASTRPTSAWILPTPTCDLTTNQLGWLAQRLNDVHRDPPALLLVVHAGGGAALGRSVRAELTATDVVCIEVPEPRDMDDLMKGPLPRAVTEPDSGYDDLKWHDGTWWNRTQHVLPTPRNSQVPLPVGPEDVCLVTGGTAGITAECGEELARATGVRLMFVGRSSPREARVADGLDRMLAAGYDCRYLQADVTDPGSVDELLRQTMQWGPIRGLIHGAAVNTPHPLDRVTRSSLHAAGQPKAAGLANILGRIADPHDLRLIVTFGSIIARAGLHGQAAYALANESLAVLTECWARRLPQAIVRHLEWSVWSGVGMGVSLGVVDSLRRQGVTPIPPDTGRALFLASLDPDLPTTVLIAGRHPGTPTMRRPGPHPRPLRFHESTAAYTPGVELVADCEVSEVTDPYLADHQIAGQAVLPAVVAIEAMAQTAVNLTGSLTYPVQLADLTFPRPMVVEHGQRRGLRVSATAIEGESQVATVLSAGDDHFATVRATGQWVPAVEAPSPPSNTSYPDFDLQLGTEDLYGQLLFHGPAFQRVTRVRALSAGRIVAELASGPADPGVFAGFLPAELIMGDPRIQDAGIHALQCCFPSRRLVPVAAGEFTCHTPPTGGPLLLVATEVTGPARHADAPDQVRITFDLHLVDPSGRHGGVTVAQWRGLQLQQLEPTRMGRWPLPLIGPHLARMARRTSSDQSLDVAVSPRKYPSRDVAEWLLGGPVSHSPAGRLVAGNGYAATSTAGQLRLTAVSARQQIGIDWAVLPAPAAAPPAMRGPDVPALHPVFTDLVDHGLGDGVLSTLGWTFLEATRKAGAGPPTSLAAAEPAQPGCYLLRGLGWSGVTAVLQAASGTICASVVVRHSQAQSQHGRGESPAGLPEAGQR